MRKNYLQDLVFGVINLDNTLVFKVNGRLSIIKNLKN